MGVFNSGIVAVNLFCSTSSFSITNAHIWGFSSPDMFLGVGMNMGCFFKSNYLWSYGYWRLRKCNEDPTKRQKI